MSQKSKLFLFLLILLCSACSSTQSGEGLKIDQVRPKGESIQEELVEVDKKMYQQVIHGGGSYTKARMVEVFTRESQNGVKEYRLFGIQPGSLYDLLGLRNVDILVAANGYIVPEQGVFWTYLQIIPNQKDAFIEIKRAGKSMILRYKFK